MFLLLLIKDLNHGRRSRIALRICTCIDYGPRFKQQNMPAREPSALSIIPSAGYILIAEFVNFSLIFAMINMVFIFVCVTGATSNSTYMHFAILFLN